MTWTLCGNCAVLPGTVLWTHSGGSSVRGVHERLAFRPARAHSSCMGLHMHRFTPTPPSFTRRCWRSIPHRVLGKPDKQIWRIMQTRLYRIIKMMRHALLLLSAAAVLGSAASAVPPFPLGQDTRTDCAYDTANLQRFLNAVHKGGSLLLIHFAK